MVEFLTIFIGLYVGSHPVELTVGEEVASIEIRLDRRPLTVLTGPPWSFQCDFGDAPMPHELLAIARDAAGEEVDRATRWVNLTSETAGASMSLEPDSRGRPVAVRLSWRSIGMRRPRSLELLFDGKPLEVADPRRVPLPRYDPDRIHFVSATLTFTDDQVSRLEASFGGALGAEIRTELTAVAVVQEKGGRMPSPAQMAGWFRKDGAELAVHGVEKGVAEVVFVRDPSAQPQLDRLAELAAGQRAADAAAGPETSPAAFMNRHRDPFRAQGGLNAATRLGPEVSLSFLAPGAAPLPGDVLVPQMFPHSPTYGAGEGGFLRLSRLPAEPVFPTYFAEAVAAAGMAVHGSRRRRAVVALLGELPEDGSDYGAEPVRAYLRQLHVPLAVWALAGEATHPEWQDARFVGPTPAERKVPKRFEEALTELRQTLRRQRIVWLEGRHLPQQIELSTVARGLRLAGLDR